MERLTNREKEIPLPNADNSAFWARVHEKLAQYEDAEEQGRLVVLPCKVGDLVWIVSASFNPQIVTATVEWISAQSEKENGFAIDLYARAEDGTGWALTDYNIGKTVFLTREAAEAAMKKTT